MINPKSRPALKINGKVSSTIASTELYDGETAGCLKTCKLQYKGLAASDTWTDHIPGDTERDGVTADANTGSVTINKDAYKWPPGEKLRVNCNDGTILSAEFETYQCSISAKAQTSTELMISGNANHNP